ncbi:allophanate hydrolase [Paraburkholderia phymatum]|uniref:allophanate hydrolase n=1 Tax=Paraburkholderia phymatum TaxID=148447 RepID=UPI003172BED1
MGFGQRRIACIIRAKRRASSRLSTGPFSLARRIHCRSAPAQNARPSEHSTTAACPAFAYTPDASATLVAQLIALGAVPIGKTNLDQFATGLNGTRSPYGKCRNGVHPDYPSGGSSAGSSLAVALGVASFALGTDTAGSGRVPAALSNLVGMKGTEGLLSTAGVVPACRTLDCVTYFTTTASEASELLALTARHDPTDAYSRANPQWNDAAAFGAVKRFRFGVPQQLEFAGCDESPALFAQARAALESIGGEAVEIDFAPFVEAARLLYEGPWVAERYSVAGTLMESQPDAVLPVIRDVLAKAPGTTAVDAFRAQYRLQALKQRCDAVLAQLDCVLTPSIPRPVTLAELERDPIGANSLLGHYTNFMNLLDYAAVATPAGFMRDGLPWGVTLFGRAFTDQYLLSVADALHRKLAVPLIGGAQDDNTVPAREARHDRMKLVVCGAHLEGLALNGQLKARAARLIESTTSAPHYRLYALPEGPTQRPGTMRDTADGAAIAVEVWDMPSAEFGSFLAGIPAPLALGKVELADGRWGTGFVCEACGLDGATDITEYGGWREWLQRRPETPSSVLPSQPRQFTIAPRFQCR